MTWTKFDDGFPRHPKVLAAGEEAASLFMWVLVWCNGQLTDGAIPAAALARITERPNALDLAARLVESGLWEVTPTGWQVHDFASHNPSRADVLQRRAETSAERAKAGRKGGMAPRKPKKPRGVAAGANAEQNEAQTTTSPGPSPRPESKPLPPSRALAREETPRPPPAPPKTEPPKVAVAAGASLTPDEKTTATTRLQAMMRRSKGRFDPYRGTDSDRTTIARRLLERDVDDDLCHRAGVLLLDPKEVWPWAKNLGDTAVTIAWLLGRADDRGHRTGAPLGQLLDAAKAQRAAEVARVEREAARRAQMEAQQAAYLAQRVTQPRVTPATMPTPAFARLRVAGREALTGQPAAAPQTPDKGRAGMGWADGLDELFAPTEDAAAA